MGAAPLSWLAKIGGDTLKTKAKLLSSAINELYDDGFKKKDIVGLDYIKAATAADLKDKVPEANAVKELNSNLQTKQDYGKRVVIGSEVAVAPSASAFDNASLTVYAGAGASDARAGIGFHNVGVCGGYLYLGNDGALHFINNNGIDFQINMTQIS